MAETDDENETGAEAPKGGIGKKLVFAGVALLLVGLGVIAGPMLMNNSSPPSEEIVEDEAAQADTGPALYTSLHPPLVVNFKDASGDAHFMQITMEVMARDQDVINAVRDHTAVIRNNLILLFSSAVYEEVSTRDGKEQMLADGLQEIQGVMTTELGEPGVEAVYFTSLVIQ